MKAYSRNICKFRGCLLSIPDAKANFWHFGAYVRRVKNFLVISNQWLFTAS